MAAILFIGKKCLFIPAKDTVMAVLVSNINIAYAIFCIFENLIISFFLYPQVPEKRLTIIVGLVILEQLIILILR